MSLPTSICQMVADSARKVQFFMSADELLEYNKKGWIPGKEESEEAFLARIERVKNKKNSFPPIPSSHWEWVRCHLKELFHISPDWLFAFYSNKSLSPWEGGATWFDGKELVSIQLRKGSSLYTKEEILAHEAVHAVRGPLESVVFEEFFAYMSSDKKWRRVLGPILQRPWEVWPLFGSLALGFVSEWGFIFCALWLFLGFFRLIKSHRTLRKASEHLLKTLVDPKKVRALLFRLTDDEIFRFSRGENILAYAKKEGSLRWRLIRLAYLGIS